MRAYVTFRRSSGETHQLDSGDVIGRMWKAALQIYDPFVSEAHALVSLREGALKLLGLRGRISVGGKVVPEVTLSSGLKIGLSPKTTLEVVEVSVPTSLMALEHPTLGRRVLSGVVSLVTRPRLDITSGAHPDAAAILWSDGLTWFARLGEGDDHVLQAGMPFEIGGVSIAVIAVAINASGEITSVDPAYLDSDLHIAVRYDTVHIHRDGQPPLALDGMIARIVSDLATAGVPIGWLVMARELWPDEDDTAVLRRNWDAALARLRKKLRDARVRADLVRSDHGGNFELFLSRGDRVDDQT